MPSWRGQSQGRAGQGRRVHAEGTRGETGRKGVILERLEKVHGVRKPSSALDEGTDG